MSEYAERPSFSITSEMIDAGAQALVNDQWHPSPPLSAVTPHDARRYRRQAELVLRAICPSPAENGGMREALEAARNHLYKYTGGFAANAEENAVFDKIERALAGNSQPDSVNALPELVKALEPFVALADAVFEQYEITPGKFREAYSDKPNDHEIWSFNQTPLTYGHLRAARAALAKVKP